MSETTTIEQDPITLEENDPRASIRAARAMVPVGPAGFTNLQEQVDYAQSMAKAKIAMPEHLRGNVGDCLAIIDISQRAGLSPYMVANHTYVQSGKLCFESQLYHAFLQASGLLKGDLEARWEGEGGERVCIITGILKSDPSRPKETRSLPLKDRHPGYVLKKRYDDGSAGKSYLTYAQGEKLRAEGKIPEDAKLFSQGSPLWVTKVDLAQFYDVTRDWSRMWAPRATMGIYTVDELQDFAEDLRDVSPPQGSGLSDRLRAEKVDRTEGNGVGDARQQMAEAGGKAAKDEPKSEEEAHGPGPTMPIKDVGFKAGTVKIFEREGLEVLANVLMLTEEQLAAMKGMGPAAIKDVKDVVAKLGFALQTGAPSPAQEQEKEITRPRNPREWEIYARAWIAAETDYKAIRKRWDGERAMRNDCGVTQEERQPVQDFMVARCKELGEPQPEEKK